MNTKVRTSQKELEESLQAVQQSEHRLQTVIENLSEGLVVSDLNGQLLNWNRAALEIHGFSSLDEALLKLPEFANIFELSELDGTVLEIEQWPLPRIIRGERLRNLELRIRRIEGDWNRVFNYGGSIVREPSGKLSAIVTMSDITDRKRAEEDRRLLAAIVESSEDAIIGENLEGTVISWNRGAEKLYGYTAEEAIGQSIWMRVPRNRIDEVTAMLERRRRGESIDHFQTERLTKDGKRIQVSLTVSPIMNESGAITGSSTIARDITNRKQAEEARKLAEQELLRTNERLEGALAELQTKTHELASMTQQLWQASKLATMGELAASVAHELNNPLATLALHAESLLDRLPGDDPKRRAVEVIDQEVERMASLVSNLLLFSRRSHQQTSTINIDEELQNSLEFIHYHLRSHRINVTTDFANDLPSIHADRQQLRQLFLNLLTNASDAMPEGGTLTIRARRGVLDGGGPALVIEFSDTGIGIEPEDLPKLWEPFFTTKPEGKGTGLGLLICRRIVEEHRGTISIESLPGKGTTVRIVLPGTEMEIGKLD
jgi:PAS domain S-box-containing protein